MQPYATRKTREAAEELLQDLVASGEMDANAEVREITIRKAGRNVKRYGLFDWDWLNDFNYVGSRHHY